MSGNQILRGTSLQNLPTRFWGFKISRISRWFLGFSLRYFRRNCRFLRFPEEFLWFLDFQDFQSFSFKEFRAFTRFLKDLRGSAWPRTIFGELIRFVGKILWKRIFGIPKILWRFLTFSKFFVLFIASLPLHTMFSLKFRTLPTVYLYLKEFIRMIVHPSMYPGYPVSKHVCCKQCFSIRLDYVTWVLHTIRTRKDTMWYDSHSRYCFCIIKQTATLGPPLKHCRKLQLSCFSSGDGGRRRRSKWVELT